jgi:hypothetical protein
VLNLSLSGVDGFDNSEIVWSVVNVEPLRGNALEQCFVQPLCALTC